jgi:SAM-dependent methyltransferase
VAATRAAPSGEGPDGAEEVSAGSEDPRTVVAAGYDLVAERYYEWSDLRPSAARRAWLERALEVIPPDTDVLDLGCGAGAPMTKALAAGRRVTGVDLSATQIAMARRNVPEATFIHGDMLALELPPSSLDAVVSFYALTHVPRAEQPALLARIFGWLRPGGVFLATMGAHDGPDEVEADWLGVPMFFSHFGARRNRAMVREAGFEVLEASIVDEPEDRHGAQFLWVLARRPHEVAAAEAAARGVTGSG